MYLKTAQVAERYDISRTTIWRWIKSGRLPEPVEIGPGVKRFSLAKLQKADAEWNAQKGAAA